MTAASLARELSTTPAHLITAASLVNARHAHGLAPFPYTCQTGGYTIDQLGGEDCVVCSKTFARDGNWVKHEQVAEWQTYRHVTCPKAGAR